MSARPHHVGSPYDKDNAEWILSKFKEWGFDAHIETFQVLFPTPKGRVVEMVQPTQFRAKLQEPAVLAIPHRSELRTIADLQRLFNRWRCDRAAGLCELRQS
jgi:N-acetylated-alpha-linked acidic dipeptidase